MANKQALDQLEYEAVVAAPVATDGSNPVATSEDTEAEEKGLTAALAPVLRGIGSALCGRAGVSEVTAAEAEAVAAPLAKLLRLYNLGPKSEKGQAWLGFGLAALGIIAPRLEEARRAVVIDQPTNDNAAEPG